MADKLLYPVSMKFSSSFQRNLFICLFWSLAGLSGSHGQEILGSTRYFDERRKGDDASLVAKAEFANSVCIEAVKAFCPAAAANKRNLRNCFRSSHACGSPVTDVSDRFISKYGIGKVSADREVLKMVRNLFKTLAEIKQRRSVHESGFTPEIESRLAAIGHILGLSAEETRTELQIAFMGGFPEKISQINLDFWGYFQQFVPQRIRLKAVDGELNLNLSFRWCADKNRFVDESKQIVDQVLAAAIWNKRRQNHLPDADYYRTACSSLSVEQGDRDKYELQVQANSTKRDSL